MKDILLHVHDDPRFVSTLENALALARSSGAHLHCLQAVPIVSYLQFLVFERIAEIEARLEDVDQRQDALRDDLADQLDNEDVAWTYERETGDMTDSLLARAALADLVVLSRGNPLDKKTRRERMAFLGEMIQRSRTPLFIPGDGNAIVDPGAPAIVAWDGSYEAANAVRGAIDLLKMSSWVCVIRVNEKKRGLFPNTRVLRYLSRHGIEAELFEEPFQEEWVDEILMVHAEQKKAGYIVAGGYGHSRLGEYVFGGTTRALLKACPVGLVLAH